jgi:hypothetical protein
MRRALLALLTITGCHKAAHDSSPKDADALWALAPEGATIGVVATPRALAMLEHGWHDLHAFVGKAPELADVARQLDDRLRELTGVADLTLADYGLTADKGAALFVIGPKEAVLIVPLADRDKFLAKVHGTKGSAADTVEPITCKTLKGVYACASSDAVLATLGKGKLRDKLDARGDIELVADGVPDMPMKSIALAAQLERGGAVVRGTLAGVPASATAQLGAPVKPVLDRGHAAGFGVVKLGAFLSSMPDVPIGAGVSSGALAKSIEGLLTLSVPAGALAFDVRIPLTDPVPAQTLIDHCSDLLPVTVAALTQGGTCHVPVPMLGTALDAWVDGKTLRLGMKQPPKPADAELTRAGAELADGAWSFAFWGRGSMLAAPQMPVPPDAAQDKRVQTALRAMLMLNELGVGVRVDGDKLTVIGVVRTGFSNPPDVVDKLVALTPTDVLGGKGPELATALGSGATPLAGDLKAGYAGLVLPISLVGMSSAVAIPAFMEYMERSKHAVPPPDDVPAPGDDTPGKGASP